MLDLIVELEIIFSFSSFPVIVNLPGYLYPYNMLPRLNLKSTAFFLCDIQEKLIPTIKEASKVITVADRMVLFDKLVNLNNRFLVKSSGDS